jgi:LacI family transcriptional regulator
VPSGRDQSYLQANADAGVGLVFNDRPPAFIGADCALSDAGGAAAGTSHLLATGHRWIGLLGDRETISIARERLRGCQEPLAGRGVPFDPAVAQMNVHDSAAAAIATAGVLAAGDSPAAHFNAEKLITIGVVDRLRRLGHHREALVAFDDLTLADAVEPDLTVMAQNALRPGRVTAERVFARIDGTAGRHSG